IKPGESQPRYQYGPGCLSDQLLGEWFCRVVGLGDVLPPERVHAALSAVVRHNWRRSLADHESCQRTYALNDEAGLLLCTWPRGGRPAYPFPYADEVWTGIEYQVAAHCIYEGLVEEGLAIVRGVRARHDGARRNPWDEFECGHHYARAMASWSLLLALSGYHYSAPEGRLCFAPVAAAVPPGGEFRCLFTTGGAWGTFVLRPDGTAAVEGAGGALGARTPAGTPPRGRRGARPGGGTRPAGGRVAEGLGAAPPPAPRRVPPRRPPGRPGRPAGPPARRAGGPSWWASADSSAPGRRPRSPGRRRACGPGAG